MNSTLQEALLAAGRSLPASILVKATVAATLGLACAALARRSRAALRHTLLAAAFGVLLALPVAAIVAPPVRIVLQGARQPAHPALRPVPGAVPRRAVVPAPVQVGGDRSPQSVPLSTLLLAVWIAGAVMFLLPVILGLVQVLRLRRSALPWVEGQPEVDRLAREAGIPRRVDALLLGSLAGPMTCGILHPAIVLPEDAQSWSAGDLDRALVHELEHVRRGDWVSHCLARTVSALYWFHPLVWMAWRRLVLEAERACDDAVVGRSEATAYADQLVGIARRLSAAAKSPVLAMANRADLSARVGAVLNSGQRRGRAGKWAVAVACGAAALLVLALSPLTVVAAPQQDATPTAARFVAFTELVVVDAVVQDQGGNAIPGLSAKDFVVHEDGRPQSIAFTEYQELNGLPEGAAKLASSYYVIGYYTPNTNADGKYRKIQIELPGLAGTLGKLDYRAGYYGNKTFAIAGGKQSPADPPSGTQAASDPSIQPPQLIRKVEAAYSDEARKAKYQGTVMLNVSVGADGSVTSVQVQRSLGLGLDEKAVEAVNQWKFKPARKNLSPIPVTVQVGVSFRLM